MRFNINNWIMSFPLHPLSTFLFLGMIFMFWAFGLELKDILMSFCVLLAGYMTLAGVRLGIQYERKEKEREKIGNLLRMLTDLLINSIELINFLRGLEGLSVNTIDNSISTIRTLRNQIDLLDNTCLRIETEAIILKKQLLLPNDLRMLDIDISSSQMSLRTLILSIRTLRDYYYGCELSLSQVISNQEVVDYSPFKLKLLEGTVCILQNNYPITLTNQDWNSYLIKYAEAINAMYSLLSIKLESQIINSY